MEIIKKGLGHEIISTNNRKQSYNLLLMALCMVWDQNKRGQKWDKYLHFVKKQQLKNGRFLNLSREELRSCYVEARLTVFKVAPELPIQGEFEYNNPTPQLEVMSDKEVHEAKQKFGADVFDKISKEEEGE